MHLSQSTDDVDRTAKNAAHLEHVTVANPPGASGFAKYPRGWFYICDSSALDRGPVGAEIGQSKYVAFRDAAGRAVVLDARCSHMRADLSRGCVKDGLVHCPLHDWQYDGEGRCVRIPAAAEVPAFARQAVYPTMEFGGHVAFYNAPVSDYSMPFFDGFSPGDLYPARPLDFVANTAWYVIGGNAFDMQHFRMAHDRTLVDTPIIESPAPFARRMAATFDVTGTSFRDRLTRRFGGPQVRMTVTVWAGTLILAMAKFRRTTTCGMVFVRPLDENRTHLRTIVWVPRRRGAIRRWIDPLDAWIRRWFIRGFLLGDASPLDGVRYNSATLIEADRMLGDYLSWLMALSKIAPQNKLSKEGSCKTTQFSGEQS